MCGNLAKSSPCPQAPIVSISWSHDALHLASGASDGTVIVRFATPQATAAMLCSVKRDKITSCGELVCSQLLYFRRHIHCHSCKYSILLQLKWSSYLQVCSVASGDVLVRFAHTGPTADLEFSPTEPQLASVAPGELALWSPDSHMVFKDAVGVVCCRILEPHSITEW